MKKLAIFIGKCMLGACAAVGMGCIGMMHEWNDGTILAAFVFTGIMVSLKLGLFDIEDEPTSTKHTSIKQGARSMRPAA